MRHALLALVVVASACPAVAGEVAVAFVNPERYTDAGYGVAAQQTRQALSEHLVKLGATLLPAQRSLVIDVLDIDLAGEPVPGSRQWPDPRVVRGRSDWPALTLRYTLSENGRVISQREERVHDMGYLGSSLQADPRRLEPFVYEKHMLSEWFKERFASGY